MTSVAFLDGAHRQHSTVMGLETAMGAHNPLVELDLVALDNKIMEQRKTREQEERQRQESWTFLASRGVTYPNGVSLDSVTNVIRRSMTKFMFSVDFLRQAITRFVRAVKRIQRFARVARVLKQEKVSRVYQYWYEKETEARDAMKRRIQVYKNANPFTHVLNSNSSMWRDYLQVRVPRSLKLMTLECIYRERKQLWSAEWREYKKLKQTVRKLTAQEEYLLGETDQKVTMEIERIRRQKKEILSTPEPWFRMDLNSFTLTDLLLRSMEIESQELQQTGRNFYEPDTSGEEFPVYQAMPKGRKSSLAKNQFLLAKARAQGFVPTVGRAVSGTHKHINTVHSVYHETLLFARNPRVQAQRQRLMGEDAEEINKQRNYRRRGAVSCIHTPGQRNGPVEPTESNTYEVELNLADELKRHRKIKQDLREQRKRVLKVLRTKIKTYEPLTTAEQDLLASLSPTTRDSTFSPVGSPGAHEVSGRPSSATSAFPRYARAVTSAGVEEINPENTHHETDDEEEDVCLLPETPREEKPAEVEKETPITITPAVTTSPPPTNVVMPASMRISLNANRQPVGVGWGVTNTGGITPPTASLVSTSPPPAIKKSRPRFHPARHPHAPLITGPSPLATPRYSTSPSSPLYCPPGSGPSHKCMARPPPLLEAVRSSPTADRRTDSSDIRATLADVLGAPPSPYTPAAHVGTPTVNTTTTPSKSPSCGRRVGTTVSPSLRSEKRLQRWMAPTVTAAYPPPGGTVATGGAARSAQQSHHNQWRSSAFLPPSVHKLNPSNAVNVLTQLSHQIAIRERELQSPITL